MALVSAYRVEIYLPYVASLKEKRRVRSLLLSRLKAMNISAIEMEDQDTINYLVLLLSFASLDKGARDLRKDRVLELLYSESEHVKIEWEELVF